MGKCHPVSFVTFGPEAQCYWNCDRYIAANGGEIVYGWQVSAWPGVFIELMHHAVVRTDEGELIDPSATSLPHEGRSAFLIDNSLIPPRDYPIFIYNKFAGIGGNGPAAATIRRAHERQMDINRRIAELSKACGLAFVPGVGLVLPDVPEARLLKQQMDASMHEIDRANAICQAAGSNASQGAPH